MQQTAAGARRTARKNFQPTSTYLRISDELLQASISRFTAFYAPCCKRNASSVPGPLESRKRAAKRRLNNLSIGREVGVQTPPPVWDFSWMNRVWEGDREPRWSWSPPDTGLARRKKGSEAPLPAWLEEAAKYNFTKEELLPPMPERRTIDTEDEDVRSVSQDNALEHVDDPPLPDLEGAGPALEELKVDHSSQRSRTDTRTWRPYLAHRLETQTPAVEQYTSLAEQPVHRAMKSTTSTGYPILQVLEELAVAKESTVGQQEEHLQTLVNAIPRNSSRSQLHHITIMLRSQGILHRLGQYRAARMLDVWLYTMRKSKHNNIFPEVLAHAAEGVRLRDLRRTFASSSYNHISQALLRHWIPEDEPPDLVGSQRQSTLRKVGLYARYNSLRGTDDIFEAYELIQSSAAPSMVNAGSRHLEPLLDAIILLIKTGKPYRTCLDDIFELLLQSDRAVDFANLVNLLTDQYHIPLPRSVLRRWIMTNSQDYPRHVYRIFRKSKKLSLHLFPGLIRDFSRSSKIDVLAMHGLLDREAARNRVPLEHRCHDPLCALSPSTINIAHDLAMAFATAPHLSIGARRANVYKLYKWLETRRAPIRASFSRAIVLTFLILPGFEGMGVISAVAAFAIRAVKRIDGVAHEQSQWKAALHDARLDPLHRTVHITRWLEKEYGSEWRTIVNPRGKAEQWEPARIDLDSPKD